MKREDASADRRLANRESLVAGVAILSLMLAYSVSLVFRWPAFTNEIAPENLEASYHVLWTIKSITSSPVASHGLLPTVTLAPFPGNDISWGATVPTDGGSYIYTFFPPLGFLMPMLMLDPISIEVTFKSLAILNTIVGLVAAVGIGMLASSVVRYSTERDIYEHTNLQSPAGYTEESGSCGLVFIETVHVAPDLPKIVSLEVKNGEVRKIHRDSATVE
jgi:hypothetical protein